MGAVLGIVGLVCGLVGVIWICVLAIQNGDVAWGVLSLFCGIVALVYAFQHMDEAKIPLGLLIVGIVCNIAARFAMAGA